ncbi:hypothetical protein [Methylomonas sp. DH-1]|uniref:hypothetical protein n=1 Tax=Methylomonas sp. (strain DH-1) TaxID=1727196 RepID=UPI0007C91A42|nr:hypothetical protein [Methylomonas sp. DH-1]ANE55296.1 hypothetical protein AYM39_08990 [Methylomonas sp. DH-1]
MTRNSHQKDIETMAETRIDDNVAVKAYIAYPKALKRLTALLGTTPEELVAWLFLGPKLGGLSAYQNANELDRPPRFHFEYFTGEDYLSPLMACWFLESDIDQFAPSDRYIICAEQESAALNMSFNAARKALRNTPNPQ